MKKCLYLLLLPLFALFVACSDDDKVPQVDFSITMSNVAKTDNSFYAVKGDVVTVDQVKVESLTNQSATVTGVRYFLNGAPIFGTPENPFSAVINTENLEAGTYAVNVTCTVLQVDKRITSAVLNYPLVIVETAGDLPDGTTLGTYTATIKGQ